MPNFRGDVKTSERKSHDKSLGVNIFAGVGRLGCGWLEPTDGKWYFRIVYFSKTALAKMTRARVTGRFGPESIRRYKAASFAGKPLMC